MWNSSPRSHYPLSRSHRHSHKRSFLHIQYYPVYRNRLLLLNSATCRLDQAISMPPSPLPEASEAPASLCTQVSNRKQCAVEGCPELVAPTMWRHHMTLHAQRLLPGNVPDAWLKEHGLFICPDCQLQVANSHSLSHRTKCAVRYEFAHVYQH